MSSLGIRLISSAVAIAIAIVVLILADTIVFNLVIGIIAAGILLELYNAAKCKDHYIAVGAAVSYALAVPLTAGTALEKYRTIFAVVIVFVIFLDYIIYHKKRKFEIVFFMIASALLVTYSLTCLINLKNMDEKHGVIYVVMSLCGAWLADSGAYFAGTFLGKHKLCPEISPKKTVEGLIGGLLTNGILFVVFSVIYLNIINKSSDGTVYEGLYFVAFVLGVLCALLGTAGDLTASLIKRQCEIKDYGKIMPGHGGFLDRFDSVLFVVPFFHAFLTVFDIFK